MTTSIATPASQITDLIGWIRENYRGARVERFSVQCSDVICQIAKFSYLGFWRQSKTAAVESLFLKTIRAKQAKIHFTCFVEREQHGIIPNYLTQRKVLL